METGHFDSDESVILTPERLASIYDEAVGEGHDFDGLSKEEFLALPDDMQARAITGYVGYNGHKQLPEADNFGVGSSYGMGGEGYHDLPGDLEA